MQHTHKTLSSQLQPSGDITRPLPAVARVRKRLRLGSTLTDGPPHTEASHHPPSKVAHQRLPRTPYLRGRRGHPTHKPGPRHHDGCLPQQSLRIANRVQRQLPKEPNQVTPMIRHKPPNILGGPRLQNLLSRLDHLLPTTREERLRRTRRLRWGQASTRLHH